jgi:SET domain-containing protein
VKLHTTEQGRAGDATLVTDHWSFFLVVDMSEERDPSLKYCHPNMVLRESKLGGYGLFAGAPIKKGEIVWQDSDCMSHGVLLTYEEILALPEEKKIPYLHFAYQVSETQWLGTWDHDEAKKDASYYWNHSCDPTTWFLNDLQMEASRDIAEGEEITFDYGTMYTVEFPEEIRQRASPQTIRCLCGMEKCRGKVTINDWKIPELRERYAGRWVPFVQKRIDDELEAARNQ